MKEIETHALKPCKSKKSLLQRLSEGSLRGPLKWMASFHVDHCRHCGPAFRALVALKQGLDEMGKEDQAETFLSEDRWRKIKETCEKLN